MPWPIPDPTAFPRGKDQRITICKLCKLGIFPGQGSTWVRGSVMGMVHDECLDVTDPSDRREA